MFQKFICLSILFTHFYCFSQSSIELTDQTVKVGAGGTEELFLGFEKGDKISFSFRELKGKVIKEIEITALPENVKFSDSKTSSTTKVINVSERGVYRFRFKNGSLSPRICKVHIERIPLNEENRNFNSQVIWKTVYDTTFIPYKEDSLIGYDTLFFQKTVKELDTTTYREDIVMDRNERVHSYLNPNSSYTSVRVNLPRNKIEKYRKEKTTSWAYWIGVGDESSQVYARNVKAIGEVAQGVVSFYTTPLGGLAVGAVTDLMIPIQGEDVYYAFISNSEECQKFLSGNSFLQWNKGKGVASYGAYSTHLNDSFFIGLNNDNNTLGIDVNIKISVIREIKTFKDVTYDEMSVTPKYTSIDKVKIDVKSRKIRVCAVQ